MFSGFKKSHEFKEGDLLDLVSPGFDYPNIRFNSKTFPGFKTMGFLKFSLEKQIPDRDEKVFITKSKDTPPVLIVKKTKYYNFLLEEPFATWHSMQHNNMQATSLSSIASMILVNVFGYVGWIFNFNLALLMIISFVLGIMLLVSTIIDCLKHETLKSLGKFDVPGYVCLYNGEYVFIKESIAKSCFKKIEY